MDVFVSMGERQSCEEESVQTTENVMRGYRLWLHGNDGAQRLNAMSVGPHLVTSSTVGPERG